MTLILKGETLILRTGKEIVFNQWCKAGGRTIGCLDVDLIFYPLQDIIY